MSGLTALLKIVYLFGAPFFAPCYARFLRGKCEKKTAVLDEGGKPVFDGIYEGDPAAEARLLYGRNSGASAEAALFELYRRGYVSALVLDDDCELTLTDGAGEPAEHELILLKLLSDSGDGRRVLLSDVERTAKQRSFRLKNALLDFDSALDELLLESGCYKQETVDAFDSRKLPVYITVLQLALMAVLAALLDRLWRMGIGTYLIMLVWLAAYRLTRVYFRKSRRLVQVKTAKKRDASGELSADDDAIRVFSQGLKNLVDKAYSDIGE